jgi:hypothetical protein
MQNLSTLLPALTKERLREVCPQAFAISPTGIVSDKYVFVSTETVIDDLAELGWVPVKAMQRKSRKGVTTRFSRHMIIFQHPDIQITKEGGDLMTATIVLTNSHDGTSTFQFRIGFYRAVCENGLVIAEKEFEALRIRHMGYTFENLKEMTNKIIEMVQEKVSVINTMIDRELTEEEQIDMAVKALLIRAGVSTGSEEVPTYSQDTIKEVLVPRREEDKSSDLWTVFNRIQESMIKGGFRVEVEGKKARKLKPIKSFEKDLTVNQQLFELALEYVN